MSTLQTICAIELPATKAAAVGNPASLIALLLLTRP